MKAKIFSLPTVVFSAACSHGSILKELDCDWNEDSVTIPNHLTVKIDNAAVWSYHAYTADRSAEAKTHSLFGSRQNQGGQTFH